MLVIDLRDPKNTNSQITWRVEEILRELKCHPDEINEYLSVAKDCDRISLVQFSQKVLNEHDIEHDFYYEPIDEWEDDDYHEGEKSSFMEDI